jgi:hypothetical protein
VGALSARDLSELELCDPHPDPSWRQHLQQALPTGLAIASSCVVESNAQQLRTMRLSGAHAAIG